MVRVPVPRSCVPHFTTTPPSDMMSTWAFEPRPPPPHWCTEHPMPVLIGPDCASPVPLVPPEGLRTDVEIRPPHRVRRLRWRVLDPKRHRVHPDAIGELVHQDFRQEASLWMARGSHRPLLAGVDVDVGVGAPPVRAGVDVREREV